MTLVEELQAVATEQHQDADLPVTLLSEIMQLVSSPELSGKEPLVRKLIEQLRSFDLYAGAGCFSESCGVKDISQTLQQLAQSN